MDYALKHYLGEVLGIDLVPSFVDEQALDPSQSFVGVLTGYSLNESETQMLKKMMLAIGSPQYRVLEQIPTGQGVGLVFGRTLSEDLGLDHVGMEKTIAGWTWIRTHSFKELLYGSAEEILRKKKETWEHLKRLQVLQNQCHH